MGRSAGCDHLYHAIMSMPVPAFIRIREADGRNPSELKSSQNPHGIGGFGGIPMASRCRKMIEGLRSENRHHFQEEFAIFRKLARPNRAEIFRRTLGARAAIKCSEKVRRHCSSTQSLLDEFGKAALDKFSAADCCRHRARTST